MNTATRILIRNAIVRTSSTASSRAYSATTMKAASAAEHEYFLKEVAKIGVPSKLDVLLDVVELQGQEVLSPFQRAGLNPFLIPISRNTTDNSLLCYLRWPTQKVDMDLQLVRTTEVGAVLEALSTDLFIHRQLVEMDFFNHPHAQKAISLANKANVAYNLGDHATFTKAGKFPSSTEHERRLLIDRYVLTKVGAFPDCYERLANNFFNNKNDVSGLVTCERSSSVFYGWGHISSFHALALSKIGREKEGRDTAFSSMHLPKWTLARNKEELEKIITMSGYTNLKTVGDLHKFRSTDPRQKEVDEEGLSPAQVALDQAAHLMDAVTLGSVEGGWDAVRADIAQRYRLGGYPEMADFIECTKK